MSTVEKGRGWMCTQWYRAACITPPAVIRSASGERLFTVGSPGSKFQAGGTEFTYNVRAKAGNFTETLTAYGPLNGSIAIEVHTSLWEILMYAFTEYGFSNHTRHCLWSSFQTEVPSCSETSACIEYILSDYIMWVLQLACQHDAVLYSNPWFVLFRLSFHGTKESQIFQ